jgi:aspartyl-tRNA(Asn)/glutamyl-tRNA(Gln) amidotransferase subunit A
MTELSIAEAGAALRAGTTTSAALTRAALACIADRDPVVNAFITVTAERAVADAARADAELAAGQDRGPMHGIPYGLKDIYDTAGIRTTCHSRLRLDNVPDHDSEVAARLAAAGGVLLGKLATHEFAIGGPGHDLPFPPARNPWNPDHIPAGSSSGSGAAVASGMTRMAMGSDTGGSIRNPAGFCGTVGLKPSYGRVSRRGVFPLSTTLDHCGPLTRSVEDAAITLQIIAGFDPRDPASADTPVPDYAATLQAGVAGLRIGVPRAFFANAANLMVDVRDGIERTLAQLREAGAIVQDIVLPDYELFATCGRVIMLTEAFAIHQRDFQTRPLDYGAMTYDRVAGGSFTTGADLIAALRVRRELTDAVNNALQHCDALITASSLVTATRFDNPPAGLMARGGPNQNMPFNVTGSPALAVPIGLAGNGLPIGLQIVGRPFDEAMVLRIGRAVEQLSGWENIPLPVKESGAG